MKRCHSCNCADVAKSSSSQCPACGVSCPVGGWPEHAGDSGLKVIAFLIGVPCTALGPRLVMGGDVYRQLDLVQKFVFHGVAALASGALAGLVVYVFSSIPLGPPASSEGIPGVGNKAKPGAVDELEKD